MREAELTHCRLAMLAALGFVFPEIAKLPGEIYGSVSPIALEAQQQVPLSVWAQIGLTVAVSEGLRSQKIWQEDHVPGKLGFDPLNLAKNKTPEQMRVMELKEVRNGRLAMIGISGMIAQQLVNGKGILDF